jgi:uncharacterized OB-fold protein
VTEREPVTTISTPIRLEYTYTPGAANSRFLRAIAQRRLIGERCPSCGRVYVPSHGSCARCGVETTEEVELKDTGTVTMFCIVNVPFAGQHVQIPYVSASVLLDGADVPIFHLIQEIDASEARIGMRVRAAWEDRLEPDLRSIKYFTPTGEPDVPVDELRAGTDA